MFVRRGRTPNVQRAQYIGTTIHYRACKVFGGELGLNHDRSKCVEAYLKKFDAEGNPSNMRSRS